MMGVGVSLETVQQFLTKWLGPSPSVVIITCLIALTLPLLLHIYLYRTRTPTQLPAFLLVGLSGSGKTTLLTQLERGKAAQTRTSQSPQTAQCSLPRGTTLASTRYRAAADPSNQVHSKLLLIDHPGHGKLRQYALSNAVKPQNLKGIIFVVDATTLDAGGEDQEGRGLAEAAHYLHDVLLTLQTRHTKTKTSKGPTEMPVLVAANKMDLFTALPAKLVKSALEGEIGRFRKTKEQGLLDSGVDMDDATSAANEMEILGGGGEGSFKFGLMEEYNIHIEVLGGSVMGSDGPDTKQWCNWIGKFL